MDPVLPLLAHPPPYASPLNKEHFHWGTSHPTTASKGSLDEVAGKARETLKNHHDQTEVHEPEDGQTMEKKQEVWDDTNDSEATRVNSSVSQEQAINKHLSAFQSTAI